MTEKQAAEIAFAMENIEQEITELADCESIDWELIETRVIEREHLKSALFHLKQAGYGTD